MMEMQSKKSEISLDGNWDLDFSNELNMFYSNFNSHNFSKHLKILLLGIIMYMLKGVRF